MANTISKSWRHLARLTFGACFALVAACSGDSSGTTEPTPKPNPSPTANGVLLVTVTGLDAGQAAADIVVTGPASFSRSLTWSGTLSGLAAGRYTISSRVVSSNGRTYAPTPVNQTVDIGSDGLPVTATVAYRAETGVVIVGVTGLPGGEPADITLSPPSGAMLVIASSRQLDDVLPGRWRLDAAPVGSGGHTYKPTPANYDVTLAPNDTARMPVEYKLATGAIAVAVSGLPSGTNASLMVTGPGGYSQPVTGTMTLTGLVPGEYHVSSSPVNAGVLTYATTPSEFALTVTASLMAEPLDVRYKPQLGRIDISTPGLPTSVVPRFMLSGSDGTRAIVGRSVDSLVPGTYTLAAAPLPEGAITYTPTPSTQSVSVSTSSSAVSFAYTAAASPGNIDITISGLGGGDAADVVVTGPNGFTETVTASTTVGGLAPGLYTIVARNVRTALGTFSVSPATREVNVTAGATVSSTLAYVALPAVVQIPVAGLPAGMSAAITVTTPSSSTIAVPATTTISPAATGRWRLSAGAFVISGVTYTPAIASYDQTALAGDTLRFPVNYSSASPSVGSLNVAITGLPVGSTGNVSVSGPNSYAQSLTATTTLSNLAPGSYTLNASSVSISGDTYTPSPISMSVSVAAGATANASIAYATSSGSGTNLSIENVYVMQAAQNWSGSAPIVTGRDALVRVFVKASAANTLQPDVRVRVYEGGTLIQTATITAPAGSVPTFISEGSLGSTWNLRIAAANVRAGLRVLADVDPGNVIGESNRTDNTWPSDGTPATIPTATVPTLTVKFVPVTLNGQTGNVTAANRDQFLATTRLIMPVQAVATSVRAAFSSSAPPLESSNGNNAWSTVLSEINALRAADGAAANVHYYGVVKAGYSSGVAGIAYVPGRAAVGWDALPSGDKVAAHELGHNFSRPHTPCGVSGDSGYPYAGGVTGVYGWNSTTSGLVSSSWTDIMGYCSNQWISDWTWSKVIEYRSVSGFEAAMTSAGDGLLIWGRVTDGRVVLEPAFRVHARPTPRPMKSSHRVVLSDASGSPLVDMPIESQVVDHVNDHEERQFAVVVPWSDALERTVSRMAVVDARSPFPAATRASASIVAAGTNPGAIVMPDPGANVKVVNANRSTVTWNSARYPMAMVRDPATGEILSFLRSSGDGFSSGGRAVDIVFSDGVRSETRRVTPAR